MGPPSWERSGQNTLPGKAKSPLEAAGARSLIACPREVGSECPHCGVEVVLGDPIMVCQVCGTVHHRSCWKDLAHCGSYSCAPARRPSLQRETAGPVLSITQFDLDRAVPLPASVPRVQHAGLTQFARGVPAATAPAGVNKLAIASLICGLAGIPLFGLITGLVAAFLGAFALASIRVSGQRGLAMALAGLLLGIADVTGWIILLGIVLVQPHSDLRFAELAPDITLIKELEPGLQRAMRANVLIERPVGPTALGGKAIGSGVVLEIKDGEALIVTNRHVVDDEFPSSGDAANDAGRLGRLGGLKVKTLGPAEGDGEVVWLAPGQIDLALVRSSVKATSQAQAATWRRGRPMKVGASVFAIGNPHNLGWSHTQGVISQLRTQDIDFRQLRVIQTQAAINPGNSGGGLYDNEGYLLGINSWTADKSVSEGLGFAIALDSLLELAPPQLEGHDGNATTPKELTRP
jgi:S1-C subfamily serine protease